MGIFDIFGTGDQQQAAQSQIAGLNAGNSAATGNINSGIGAINTGYSAALQPFLQNYGAASAGQTQLGNVLGLNGQSGNQSALNALRNTPGYQFQQQSQDATVNAQAAASGMNASGNQLLALNKVNQGLADSTYNQYVSQLQPFLGASNAAAGGIANVNTGQANATAGQYDTLAGLNYGTQTGIGNANANADLAGLTQSQNILGAGMNIAKLGASIFSDERLKEEIEKVGELYDGSNVYRYNYIGDPTSRIGLMAQEVEKTRPDSVVEIGGYKAVDYSKATQYAADLARFLEAA
jgi:Chaperone of endosialidase